MNKIRIALNAKLGDGCIVIQKEGQRGSLMFQSTNLDWINYKRDLCMEYKPRPIGTQESGYGGKKTIYKFETRVGDGIAEHRLMSNTEAIEMLDLEDLTMWYLDDGTYHQKKHFMHLYCNMLTEEETLLLANKIHKMFPNCKIPKLRWDKKKDGRKYPYLYFPTDLSRAFKEYVKEFLLENSIHSMLYKVGYSNESPSTTIEKQ